MPRPRAVHSATALLLGLAFVFANATPTVCAVLHHGPAAMAAAHHGHSHGHQATSAPRLGSQTDPSGSPRCVDMSHCGISGHSVAIRPAVIAVSIGHLAAAAAPARPEPPRGMLDPSVPPPKV